MWGLIKMIKQQNSLFWHITVFMFLSSFSLPMAVAKEFLGYHLEDNFDTAMIGLEAEKGKYQNFLARTSAKVILGTIKEQYHRFVTSIADIYSIEPKIPKIIHQIWVGPHQFPKEAKAWQETWLKLHPDWEYKLWTNEDVEMLDFENKEYYNQATNWGEKADILRYEILYRFGGVYVDVDEMCLKSLDVLHHTCDFYTAVHQVRLLDANNNKLRINNAVIAAVPGHPILQHAVEEIKNNRKHHDLLFRAGPDFFTKVIAQKLGDSLNQGNVDVVFPANYFYPSADRKSGHTIKPGVQIRIKPETLAVHYYTSYWVKPPTN